jgi:hypothetical protein
MLWTANWGHDGNGKNSHISSAAIVAGEKANDVRIIFGKNNLKHKASKVAEREAEAPFPTTLSQSAVVAIQRQAAAQSCSD